ncbi:hypothetical protein GKE82_14350 [Conexibacter sp. W3-3-2]|uniref:hypothetical protein n=1 Tax=Conexibacter sp. W3-3-2 TaxID=2675227 RepID=UPI0012B9E9A3|nr:hypothetical protein [Conexibacter sp. W3-3-2]MTD45436.1 hypothetical protein [Conexibacter sp. W3-3-2]
MADRLALIRLYALLVLGSMTLHELRYALPGEASPGGAHAAGHGYLAALGPLVGMLAALVLAATVLRAAAGTPGRGRAGRLWPLLSAGVFGLYAGQELLEGLLSHHHADGLSAVFGAGGWVALPVAVVLGAILTLTVRIADVAASDARRAVARLLTVRLIPRENPCVVAPAALLLPRRAPARERSGRGPPVAV